MRHNLLQMMLNDEVIIDEATLAFQRRITVTGFNSAKLSLSDLTPGNIQMATADIQLIWGDADSSPTPASKPVQPSYKTRNPASPPTSSTADIGSRTSARQL